MKMVILPLAWVLLALEVASSPVTHPRPWHRDEQRPLGLVDPPEHQPKMLLPVFDNEPEERIREIERKRKGWLYGRSLLGNTSHYPEGELGSAASLEHQQRWYAEAQTLKSAVYGEAGIAYMAVAQVRSIWFPFPKAD